MIRNALIVLLLAYSSNAFASKFYCEILDGKELDWKNGKLRDLTFNPGMFGATRTIGKEFIVDRTSGRIIEGIFSNNFDGYAVHVLSRGNPKEKEGSYKAIAIYSPFEQLSQLIVNYNRTPMTFIYQAHYGSVYSGTCTDG